MSRSFSRRNFLRASAALVAGAAGGAVAKAVPFLAEAAPGAAPAAAAGATIAYSGITLHKVALTVFVTEELLADNECLLVESFIKAELGRCLRAT